MVMQLVERGLKGKATCFAKQRHQRPRSAFIGVPGCLGAICRQKRRDSNSAVGSVSLATKANPAQGKLFLHDLSRDSPGLQLDARQFARINPAPMRHVVAKLEHPADEAFVSMDPQVVEVLLKTLAKRA